MCQAFEAESRLMAKIEYRQLQEEWEDKARDAAKDLLELARTCPFCSKKPRVGDYNIYCASCGASGGNLPTPTWDRHNSIKMAKTMIKGWNKKAVRTNTEEK